MPVILEPVQGYALRMGKDAHKYGDPYEAMGVANLKDGRWEVVAFVRKAGDQTNELAMLIDLRAALRGVGIDKFWWQRRRKNGSSHWVPVKT